MSAYVALLRGVNVSGRNPVNMADLREVFVGLGHRDVATYIQSGNVVFQSTARDSSAIAAAAEAAIARELGVEVSVIVRSARELAAVVAGNPFLTRDAGARSLHVTLLDRRPSAAAVRELAARDFTPDTLAVAGREVYLHCPNGYGRSKLSNTFLEQRLAVRATTRNWRTITTLLDRAR